MKKKHEKRLAMARFLRTRAEPAIVCTPRLVGHLSLLDDIR